RRAWQRVRAPRDSMGAVRNGTAKKRTGVQRGGITLGRRLAQAVDPGRRGIDRRLVQSCGVLGLRKSVLEYGRPSRDSRLRGRSDFHEIELTRVALSIGTWIFVTIGFAVIVLGRFAISAADWPVVPACPAPPREIDRLTADCAGYPYQSLRAARHALIGET